MSSKKYRPNQRVQNAARWKQSANKNQEDFKPNAEITKCFESYASELDSKHDKYERILKLGRDITIESKRIIFLLHSLNKDKKNAVLQEAETRLNKLEETFFQSIAKELLGEDPFLYLRAYSPGLQEYVEALTFYHYLKDNRLMSSECIQRKLMYTLEESKEETSTDYKTLLPMGEYVLGIADLTGELMRNCINNLGSGQFDTCMQISAFVKEIYNGFLGVGNSGPREFTRKFFTLKQSLNKIESSCYAICVRGSEVPKYMLADVLRGGVCPENYEEDEGYY